jgi:hypothetical protein
VKIGVRIPDPELLSWAEEGVTHQGHRLPACLGRSLGHMTRGEVIAAILYPSHSVYCETEQWWVGRALGLTDAEIGDSLLTS